MLRFYFNVQQVVAMHTTTMIRGNSWSPTGNCGLMFRNRVTGSTQIKRQTAAAKWIQNVWKVRFETRKFILTFIRMLSGPKFLNLRESIIRCTDLILEDALMFVSLMISSFSILFTTGSSVSSPEASWALQRAGIIIISSKGDQQ